MRQNYSCADVHSHEQFVADFGQHLISSFDQITSQSLDTMYNSPTGQLGHQIRTARLQKKWTPLEIAGKLGKNEAYIYAIEHGMIPADAIEPMFIKELARFLEQEPSAWLEILKPTDPKTPHLWQRKIRNYRAKFHFDMPNLALGGLQGMVTSVAATAIICLLMISNGQPHQRTTVPVEAMPIEAVPTVAANIIYTPSLDYATYAKFSSYFCNSIQPEPTYLSLACDQVFTLWPEPTTPKYRGGYSEI